MSEHTLLLHAGTLLTVIVFSSVSKTVNYFLDGGVSKEDFAASIMHYPELLNLSLMGHIMPKAHYFQTELGIRKETFARVFVKHGWVLKLNLESDVRHTVQWLLDFGASKSSLGKLILKFPPILGYSVENNLKPKLDYFIHYLGPMHPSRALYEGDRCCVGMPFGEVSLMIEEHPGFVSASLKEHIRPLVWCLEHELSMPLHDTQQVFSRAPQIFTLSFGETIKPTIDYFILELHCTKEHFGKMLTLFPQLLCYDLENTIKPKIRWLQDTVGLGHDQIKTVALHRYAKIDTIWNEGPTSNCVFRIYPYTTEMLNNKLMFVRTQLDITHEEMQKMILADASFLHKSLSNLAKKIHLVDTELKKDRKQIAQLPQYLGYSLSARLQPRWKFLQSLQRDVSSLTLQQMFACSDDYFASSVAKSSSLKYRIFRKSLQRSASEDESEDETAEEEMLKETFFQQQSGAPIEEMREAERRFALSFKYQTV